jgi:hypothetical protein
VSAEPADSGFQKRYEIDSGYRFHEKIPPVLLIIAETEGFCNLLQKQIQGQGQQCCILIFLTVSGDQQQKQNHQKISGVEIFW